jgi:hypothetical protein
VSLWVQKEGIDEDEAYKQGHMMTGIGNMCGLFSAFFFGFYFEKFSKSNVK